MSRPQLGRPAAVLAASVLLLGACSGAPAATTAPAVSPPPGALALSAKEYSFAPTTLTATAGGVTFAVKNDGTENHEFEVLRGEEPIGEKLVAIAPGTMQSVTITLEAGTYTFACRLNGHDILGMKGTLTVQ